MAQKFYVVWKGRQTGIFTDWATCKSHVDGFNGARYKSFKTRSEAESAFGGKSSPSSVTSSRSSTVKKPSANSVKTYTAQEILALNADVKIFTDGGCDPNPGKAGSGVAVYRQNQLESLWLGLFNPNGTNNTAELNALNQALVMAKNETDANQSTVIFCDSKYSIQCITQWAVNWEKKGWKKAGGEIKNLELIQEMFARYQQLKTKIKILHVNGHVGVEGNELADRMSMLAIKSKEVPFTQYHDTLDVETILAMQAG